MLSIQEAKLIELMQIDKQNRESTADLANSDYQVLSDSLLPDDGSAQPQSPAYAVGANHDRHPRNSSVFGSMGFHLMHAWRGMKTHKAAYAIAVMSCVVVVCSTAVCITIVSRAPIIFLKQAESEKGEIDILIKAGKHTIYDADNYDNRLNFTRVSEVLEGEFSGQAAARNILSIDFTSYDCRAIQDEMKYSELKERLVKGELECKAGSNIYK